MLSVVTDQVGVQGLMVAHREGRGDYRGRHHSQEWEGEGDRKSEYRQEEDMDGRWVREV